MIRFTRSIKRNFNLHFEWLALAVGLFLMAILNPESTASSLCPLDYFDATFCPGEGLGKSIALFFRGNLTSSLLAHPAGIPAVFIISGRIFYILSRNRTQLKNGD